MEKIKRINTSSYSPSQFFELLNNYYNDGWRIIYYKEVDINGNSPIEFTVVLEYCK